MGDSGQNLGLLSVWCDALSSFVASDQPDLSTRQLAIMLNVYMRPGAQTVRGLAESLSISKPAVSRALDSLGARGLVRRQRDESDRRNVLVQRTEAGLACLMNFSEMVREAQKAELRIDG